MMVAMSWRAAARGFRPGGPTGGTSMAARTPRMAITTITSMRVKARTCRRDRSFMKLSEKAVDFDQRLHDRQDERRTKLHGEQQGGFEGVVSRALRDSSSAC